MDIELNRLSAVPVPLRGEVLLADETDPSLARDGIRFPDPFRFDGEARLDRGQVLVVGTVEGSLQLQCGRCLGDISQPVSLEFEARYVEAGRAPQPVAPSMVLDDEWADSDGVELTAGDMDVSFLPAGTTVLKVEDVVREQVLLEVPIRPLCTAECPGLCPRCGAVRSAGCDCSADEVRDIRLAALAEIKKRLDGGSGRKN